MSPVKTLDKNETGGLEEIIRKLAVSSVIAAGAGMSPGGTGAADYVVESMTRVLGGGESRVIVHESGGPPDGILVWNALAWDSSITGRSCARISMLGGENCGELVSHWLEKASGDGVEYTTVRIPAESEFHERQVDALESAGFSKIEEIVYLSAPTGDSPEICPGIVEADTGDMEEIRKIARGSFSFDRFHRETLFEKDIADRIHEEWARGSFAGRAQAILARKGPEGWPVGYCTILIPESEFPVAGWIDMLAVRPGEREKGTGRMLTAGALSWLKRAGIAKAALCTQSDNLPALGLYDKTGFDRYASAETWRCSTVRS